MLRVSLVAQMVKNLPAMQETQLRSLSGKDSLKKGMAPKPVFLPGEFHRQTSIVGTVHGTRQRVGKDWKTNILNFLAFSFFYQYMTTTKTLGVTTQTLVGKVMSWIFNTLSRCHIFLPKSKLLLISWLQSLSAVFLELTKIKSVIVSIFPHLFARKWWDWVLWS